MLVVVNMVCNGLMCWTMWLPALSSVQRAVMAAIVGRSVVNLCHVIARDIRRTRSVDEQEETPVQHHCLLLSFLFAQRHCDGAGARSVGND